MQTSLPASPTVMRVLVAQIKTLISQVDFKMLFPPPLPTHPLQWAVTAPSAAPLCTRISTMLLVKQQITVFALQGKDFSAAEKQLESFQSHGLASFSCRWSHPNDLLQRFSVLFPSIIQPNKKVQHSFIPPSFHSSYLLKRKKKCML